MTTKHDSGKWRFSLVPFEALRSIIAVLEFGAQKYAPDNWKMVPDARTRYYDAAIRHLTDWFSGEKLDQESGENHLAHAACCIMFLLWFDTQGEAAPTESYEVLNLLSTGYAEIPIGEIRDNSRFEYVTYIQKEGNRVFKRDLI